MQIAGIEDVPGLFKSVSKDALIAKMLPYSQTLQLARSVGVMIPKKRLYEIDLVGKIRQGLLLDQQSRPCSGCVLDGKRWYKLNTGEPLLYSLDRAALSGAYEEAERAITDVLGLIKGTWPAINTRERRVGEVADVGITAEKIDGRFGTLGFATTYSQTGTDDLDVGADRWVSATLTCDAGEYWTYGFFFTVFMHEFLHILGLEHAPPEFDDIMRAFYAGDRRTFGPWTESQMDLRYVGVVPA